MTEDVKRGLKLGGRFISVSVEAPIWEEFTRIADRLGKTTSELAEIVNERHRAPSKTLSSSIKLFVVKDLQKRLDRALKDLKKAERANG